MEITGCEPGETKEGDKGKLPNPSRFPFWSLIYKGAELSPSFQSFPFRLRVYIVYHVSFLRKIIELSDLIYKNKILH